MRLSIRFVLPIVLLLVPNAVPAQEVSEEVWEAQRCIWRCLAEHGHGRRYERCVARKCNDEPAPKSTRRRRDDRPAPAAAASRRPAVPRPLQPAYGDWERSKEPFPMYGSCPSDLMCLMIACRQRGSPSLELYAIEHGSRDGEIVALQVDDARIPLRLSDPVAPDTHWRWPLDRTLAARLREARSASVSMNQGTANGVVVSLRGSGAAVDAIVAACR